MLDHNRAKSIPTVSGTVLDIGLRSFRFYEERRRALREPERRDGATSLSWESSPLRVNVLFIKVNGRPRFNLIDHGMNLWINRIHKYFVSRGAVGLIE